MKIHKYLKRISEDQETKELFREYEGRKDELLKNIDPRPLARKVHKLREVSEKAVKISNLKNFPKL